MFGTNGGGFFNANSAHPYEKSTPFSNFFEMVLIFAIPSALTYTLGRMTGSQRHGWAVWAAMTAMFLVGVTATYWAEARGNPQLTGVNQVADVVHSGGNMEAKKWRFGIANTALFATTTTDASCGAGELHATIPLRHWAAWFRSSTSCWAKSFSAAWDQVFTACWFLSFSQCLFAGLMVGRTPEYLGKKIEAFDVKMAMLSVLFSSLTILVFAAVAVLRSLVPPASPTQALMGSRRFFMPTLPPREITVRRLGASTRTRSGTTPAQLLPCCWADSLS